MPKQSGQIALIAILIIASATLLVALTLSSIGISETQSGLSHQKSERAFQLANTCVDEATLRLRRVYDGEEASYGGGTLTFGSDSCIITITPSGNNRIVDVVSTVDFKINRKIRATVQVSPTFSFLTFQEQP